jgi:hypothetical protein
MSHSLPRRGPEGKQKPCEQGCRDLAVQQKAIDRLKQITGQDFGLKPSAEWVKDQKEPSDKYDAWWQSNRDNLTWSDKDDKYLANN